MKKLVALFLIVIVSVSAVFAAEETSVVITPSTVGYSFLNEVSYPTSARKLAMGGASVANLDSFESLYYNPAGLGQRKLNIGIPYLALTVYHPQQLMDKVPEFLEGGDMSKITETVLDLFSIGNGALATVDAGFTFTVKGFGLGLNIQDKILTYTPSGMSGGTATTQIIDFLNIKFLVGFGYRFNLARNFSIDFGGSLGFRYIAYNKGLTASDAMNISDVDAFITKLRTEYPVMAGFSIPLNAGLNINLPLGFTLGTVFNNIMPINFMHAFSSFDALNNNYFGNSDTKSFNFNSRMDWSVGLAWTYKPGVKSGNKLIGNLFNPTIEADLVDLLGFIESKDMDIRNWVQHLKVGIEINTLWVLSVRAGMDSGYFSIGGGLNLYALKLDVAYFWHEFGDVAGSKGIDGLTISMNLGW